MITLRQAVVVEGKYDKIKLSNFIDALIIVTDGFGVFKDKQKLQLIRLMAKSRGIILMTDSDSAGFIIRNFLADAVKEGEVTHVYIPEIGGKEKRKQQPSAEGLLGVEGLSEQTITEALSAAGIIGQPRPDSSPVTKLMMYTDGFYGGNNSSELRRRLCTELGLPTKISPNMLPRVISEICGEDGYKRAVSQLFCQKNQQNQ